MNGRARTVGAIALVLSVGTSLFLLGMQYDDLPLWFRLVTASAVFIPLAAFSLVWAVGPQRTHVVRTMMISVVAISGAVVLATFVWELLAE